MASLKTIGKYVSQESCLVLLINKLNTIINNPVLYQFINPQVKSFYCVAGISKRYTLSNKYHLEP